MSYLQIPNGIPDFNKAVISLWFRVPQASLDTARAQGLETGIIDFEKDTNAYYPAFFGVIPLVTFGSSEHAVTGYGDGSGLHPTSPSFIGVDCNSIIVPTEKNSLAVHLAMSNTMSFTMTPMGSDSGVSAVPQFLHNLQRKDAFYMSGKGDLPYAGGQQSVLEVTADAWHHILISFDLSNPAGMRYTTAPSSAPPFAPAILMLPDGPTFMWAFDNEDKTDYSLSPSSAQVYNTQRPGSVVVPPEPLPLKQITTNNLIYVAGGAWAFEATWEPVPIKSFGNPVGVPASSLFVDNVYNVELAEFQMWTGVTLDTEVESNRRAFIDYERDANGNPVIDTDGNRTLKPVPPTAAEALLGRKPDILLHGSGKWIAGENTGTTGVDYGQTPPVEKPAGQFQPTGGIKQYKPDPSLVTEA